MSHRDWNEYNYWTDERATARLAELPELDGAPLPHRWVVCDLCQGRGTVVNPSIDAGGLTAEDFHDDPDFSDNYRSGVYDIQCPRCGGRTTIPEVDVSRCTFAQKRVLVEMRQRARDDAEYDRITAMERRMGA